MTTKNILQDALATLLRWKETVPEMWDERDQETMTQIEEKLKELK